MSDDAAHVRVPPPAVFVAVIAIGAALHALVEAWPVALDVASRVVVAAVLGALGAWLAASAIGLFRKSGQDPAPWKPTPSLVTSGPYRFTRNPMYIGLTSLTLAIGIGAGSSWIVLGAPLALAIVHAVAVRHEEAYLAKKFGDDYETYRTRVPRYL